MGFETRRHAAGHGDSNGSTKAIAVASVVLAVLACLSVIYFARAVLLPITLAVLLNLVFKPIIDRMKRYRIPAWLGAAILMTFVAGALLIAIGLLWSPALTWFHNMPEVREQLVEKLQPLKEPVSQFNEATREVERLAGGDDGFMPLRVQVDQPGLASFLLNTSGDLMASIILTAALLFMLLANGDRMLERIVSMMPTLPKKKAVVALVNSVQSSISNYLLTIAWINVGVGLAIGAGMWVLGLPNPMLWGAIACLLNFVPFIGAAMGAVIVFVVALLEFDLGYALLAPGLYAIINGLEGNVVTPMMLGQTARLSPVAVLLALTIGGWMWGVGGVLVAVPLLMGFKVTCDHIELLKPYGRLIEG